MVVGQPSMKKVRFQHHYHHHCQCKIYVKEKIEKIEKWKGKIEKIEKIEKRKRKMKRNGIPEVSLRHEDNARNE